MVSTQSIPLAGSVTIRMEANDLPVPVVKFVVEWVSASVKVKFAAMKESVSSSLTVRMAPATMGTSLLLSSRSVKSVATVALPCPEPSLAVTRMARSVAPAGGLPLRVPVTESIVSQGGSAEPLASVAE